MLMPSIKFKGRIARMGPRRIIVIPKKLEPMTSELLNKILLVEIKEDTIYE